jgi:hypothetical protein
MAWRGMRGKLIFQGSIPQLIEMKVLWSHCSVNQFLPSVVSSHKVALDSKAWQEEE